MTGTTIRYLLALCLFLLLAGCSIEALLPEGCVTIVVFDEDGRTIEGMNVGIGFEKNTGSGTRGIPVRGKTDARGRFTGKHHTLNTVQYRAYKEGYYESSGTYKFQGEAAKKWQPWNPELVLVMRRIERRVPMYARDTQDSKHLELPALDKAVGFDLVKYAWVRPYGPGEHADLVFKAQKNYLDDDNYEAQLSLTFTNSDDGIITIKEDRFATSEFKLPRYAPAQGYEKRLTIIEKRVSGRVVESTESETDNYIFRVRSKDGRRRVPETMYGKILGGIRIDPMGTKTAIILFKYYLNPDHSPNLEFDPSKNLFTGLKSFEEVGVQ